MSAFLFHRNEWVAVLILLVVSFSVRINNLVDERKTRSRNEEEVSLYKEAHQAELIKEWVTSQYCKTDLDILCPSDIYTTGCYAAFDPPLLFVLELNDNGEVPKSCNITKLLKKVWEEHHEDVSEMSDDELLTSLIAHVMKQIRSKSAEYFRADDRSIMEFEQSRLIELSLASFLDLFSSPTKQNKDGKVTATKATEFGLTNHIWTRDEVLRIMDDAVMYHTHHKRHGSTEEGAAARLSRQQPSFVFKYLPLVKEQISNLEYDASIEKRLRKLYPFPLLSREPFSLNEDSPESDSCLWSHFQEGSLISEDCILALDTAPLKIRDLDWEGDFSFVLVHIYTGLSAALLLWFLSRILATDTRKSGPAANTKKDDQVQDATIICSSRSLSSSSSRSLCSLPDDTSSDEKANNTHGKRIHNMQKACFVYLVLSCMVGMASSRSSEKIRFSDFLDGLCLSLLGYLSFHLVPIVGRGYQASNKRTARKLYHKDSSVRQNDTTEPLLSGSEPKAVFADLT